MNSDTKSARDFLNKITTLDEFMDLLDRITMCATGKQIILLHYVGREDLLQIADTLGFSEQTVKRHHKHALQKIAEYLKNN